MNIFGKSDVKRVQIEAIVIRADGTREDLGLIADSKWRFKPWTRARRAAKRRTHEVNQNART